MLEKEEIKKILPHREPLLLIDQATLSASENRVEAKVNVEADWLVFTGHFPEKPMLPGNYMIESMAQTADILLLFPEQNRGKIPLLFQVSQMRFYHPVYPGECMYLTAEIMTDAGNGMYDCKVSARTETGRVAAGVITLVLKTMEQI
mgnify:FL=1